MGKGDKKSRKGKIAMGSYGVTRKKKVAVKKAAKKAAPAKKAAAPKKAAPKKAAKKAE
ncbi:MAG: 30S ribosomal protein THX [Bacteroidota bacterium]|nr:30S ribosomal protein THX [Bacteroidota bacterium]